MKLSVIIVNYNVRFFLDQCLRSVFKALKNISSEVFVVDNNSLDGSISMIRKNFPYVKLIRNNENYGFSRANNQAIKKAGGEYILLLNPDTMVEEFTFEKCIRFMDEHKDAGALGVRLIDGKGRFLPESKRSLPTPGVAFFKIFGLTRLFSKSKLFGKYNLGYLNPEETHKVDVLPGAFMFLRMSALDKTGLLDENFFMYGEDIDLSYRLKKAGFSNYYYPGTTIIHYKGESTRKSSINYVVQFYKSMKIFAKKHFSIGSRHIFLLFINLAIYFRASLSILKRAIGTLLLPLIDALLIFSGFFILTPFWAKIKFQAADYYPVEFLQFVVPVYILIWIISIYINNGYDKPARPVNILLGIFTGTIFILIIYALLPSYLRFSRALILMGGILALGLTLTFRFFVNKLGIAIFKLYPDTKKILIIADHIEYQRLKKIIPDFVQMRKIAGFVHPGGDSEENDSLGPYNQLSDIIRINKVDEIIFSAKAISSEEIIQNMMKLSQLNIDFKIAHPEGLSIIGSHSIDSKGEIFEISLNAVSKKKNLRKKRVLDLTISLLFLLTLPISLLTVKKKYSFIVNIFYVISGRKSWVGYNLQADSKSMEQDSVQQGVLTPASLYPRSTGQEIKRINLSYAKDYRLSKDLEIILKKWKQLGEEGE
ncbi:MAG: glycosyltransferase [Bacteroidales bacterium]|nr:glycosyltransferase [Bacteroidales bacterium]